MLTPFYAGWDRYQRSLVAAIAPLSTEHLALHLLPHWSIGQITSHVIAARVWWLYSRAGEGSDDLAPLEHWDAAGAPLREAAELAMGLERTWEIIADVLERWTLEDLEQVLETRPDDPVERTRQWILWHLIEHDLTHGGEISCTLVAHGLAAVALE